MLESVVLRSRPKGVGSRLTWLLMLATWVVVAAGLCLPSSGWAQALVEGSGAVPTSTIAIEVETGAFKTNFFEHRDFGFHTGTLRALADDVSSVGETVRQGTARMLAQSPGATWLEVWRYLVLLVLLVGSVSFDIWMRRRFGGLSRKVTLIRMSVRALALRSSALRLSGHLSAPLLGWLISFFVQGLFNSALWTVALSNALLLFVAYRLAWGVLEEVLSGLYFPVPHESARRILRVMRRTARVTVTLFVAQVLLDAVQYRPDVTALLRTSIRASIALFSLQLFALQRPLLSLLPADGTARYLRFKALCARYLPYILLGSVGLLGLWAAGFERAATTLLSRMYGIIGLVVLMVLAQRWFDLYTRGDRKPANRVVAALLDTIDGSTRLLIYGLFAAGLLDFLGLWQPLLGLLDSIGIRVGERSITLLNVVRSALVIAGAVVISRVLRTILETVVYPRVDMEVGAAYALNTALFYFILVISGGLALVVLGVDLGAMAVFSGALGIGIGFGLQDIARNVISGFILLFGGSVQKGDLIAIGNVDGYVEKLGGRAVTIRTRDNQELLVPTSHLMTNVITNYTHTEPHYRLHVPVGVAYGSDPYEVRNALLEAAHRYYGTCLEKETRVWMTGFGDSAVKFELLVWINAAQIPPKQAVGEIMFHIWDVLREQNIEIPFPQQDLNLRSVTPEVARVLRPGDAEPRPIDTPIAPADPSRPSGTSGSAEP